MDVHEAALKTFWEAASKKRGRPNKHPWILPDQYIGPAQSHRGRKDTIYAYEALTALRHEPGLEWLIDLHRLKARDPQGWKQGILTELGRLIDAGCPIDVVVQIARDLCLKQPKTKTAIEYLRRIRLNREPTSQQNQLEKDLIATIHRYCVRYPSTSPDDLFEALYRVAGALPL